MIIIIVESLGLIYVRARTGVRLTLFLKFNRAFESRCNGQTDPRNTFSAPFQRQPSPEPNPLTSVGCSSPTRPPGFVGIMSMIRYCTRTLQCYRCQSDVRNTVETSAVGAERFVLYQQLYPR